MDYNFDAPQFFDLREPVISQLDDFFETKNKMSKIAAARKTVDDETTRRVTFICDDDTENEDPKEKGKHQTFRSTPAPVKHSSTAKNEAENEDLMLPELQNLTLGSCKKVLTKTREPLRVTQVFEGIPLLPTSAKKHSMVTRSDTILRTPKLILRSRAVPKHFDTTDDLEGTMESEVSSTSHNPHYMGQLKRKNEGASHEELPPRKFVSLAEQVAKFHKETPDRFRSKPHHVWQPSHQSTTTACIPKSPNLVALGRNRKIYFPTKEEREEMEYKYALNHQFKAKPVSDKIFSGFMGLKTAVEKRPTTLPEPFKLTEIVKKPIEEEPMYKFKAQPVPKKILQETVGIPAKKPIPVTAPITPGITASMRYRAIPSPMKRSNSTASVSSCGTTVQKTRIQPFSFDERDRQFLNKKEEKIKKILEDEKKSFSSFKATALPSRSYAVGTPGPMRVQHPSKEVPTRAVATPNEIRTVFKANPATVLHKPVFVPKYTTPKTPSMAPFKLKTEVRAVERHRFDEKIRQHEEEARKALEKKMEEEAREVEEEVKRLKKQAEFKAHPMPHYKTLDIQPSSVKLTKPISPKFHCKKTE